MGAIVQVKEAAVRPQKQPSALMIIFRDQRSKIGIAIVFFLILVALVGQWPIPYSINQTFVPLLPPSWHHLFGTTDQGQDVLSLFLNGAGSSLVTAFLAGGGAAALGTLLGVSSGFFGGWLDEAMQLITNVFLVIPALPLMVVLAAYLTFGGNLSIVLVIIFTGWSWGARMLRAQAAALRKATYVDAARISGESTWGIIRREILANMWSLVFANFLSSVIFAVITAASLQFLGLGNINSNSWGTMLYWAQNDGAISTGAWWWFVIPGLGIALFSVGLTLINYGLDQISNTSLQIGRKSIHGRK